MSSRAVAIIIVACLPMVARAAPDVLPNTGPLTREVDFSEEMLAGMTRYLDRELVESVERRATRWHPDSASAASYEKSVEPNRERFARVIGAIDSRLSGGEMQFIGTNHPLARVAETERFSVHAVRWPVFSGVQGEGLLLQPKGKVIARIVAIPDADQTPESLAGLAADSSAQIAYASRLAASGCLVVIPTILSRANTYSGNAWLRRYTNQPHREWIYRPAYTFGRHVIGYEVQRVLAAVDWFDRQNAEHRAPIGVIGWGEGGLLAFYSAALDRRIDAAVVSGYFNARERLWSEPIYRNLWGLLREFGDAEIARLIVPRTLIVEHAPFPAVDGPPPPLPTERPGGSAAPGRIVTASAEVVAAEIARARLHAGPFALAIHLLPGVGVTAESPLGAATLTEFLHRLNPTATLAPASPAPLNPVDGSRAEERQRRQMAELEGHAQSFIEISRQVRDEALWRKVRPANPEAWHVAMQPYRDRLWSEVTGRLPAGNTRLNPRSRKIMERPTWTGYEVILDVLPDISVWGYLLLPEGMQPGERRPVIVAQHGGSGLPITVITEDAEAGFRSYKAYAARLAERGFIVFCPHFPWRAGHRSSELQRKANPLGLSFFSFILAHHDRILDWLTAQSFVDPKRIGLYGLSWGGKVAIRAPALLDRYALSVCSGDFNEWTWKNATINYGRSFVFSHNYDAFEFNLGLTFSYAEIAAMIAPRPFMVERGHDDAVGIDEMVAYEYAKVNRLYNKLGIPDRTEIEFFDGGHEIRAKRAFDFIHHHFNWPPPGAGPRKPTR